MQYASLICFNVGFKLVLCKNINMLNNGTHIWIFNLELFENTKYTLQMSEDSLQIEYAYWLWNVDPATIQYLYMYF